MRATAPHWREVDIRPVGETYGEGRVCSHESCGTVLSRYNSDDFCALHKPPEQPGVHEYCGLSFRECRRCHVVKELRQYAQGDEVCHECRNYLKRMAEARRRKRWGIAP